LATAAEIPAGRFRTELEKLPPAARARALAKLAQSRVPLADLASLHVDAGGHLFYVCAFPADSAAAPGIAGAEPPAAAAATVAAAAVPIAQPPLRHSRPGSSRVLYLDFNGHTVTGTRWNTGYSTASFVCRPFDTDGNPATFSDAEQAAIIQIWERVSEDYSPFDIDVTTEEPALFNNRTARAVITRSTDANGVALPGSGAGGIAFLGVFGEADFATNSSPAFIYFNNLASGNTASIAEAVSHEIGHNLGLSHDGTTAVEYYGGHGTGETSWGPIMGTGYGRNVSQWSRGEYFQANNTQDDLAIIAARVPFRTDDAGDTPATAAAAAVSASGALSLQGVIAPGGDVDVFSFSTAAGPITLNATPYRAASDTHGGNLDIKLKLLNSAGTVLATADPAATTTAQISTTVAGGVFYLRISGSSAGTPLANPPSGYTAYGSLGQYFVTGSVNAAPPVITGGLTASLGVGQVFSYAIVATNSSTSYAATGLPAGLNLDTATGAITGRPETTGTFSIGLSATNSLGTATATLVLTVNSAAPVLLTQPASLQVPAPGSSLTLTVTAFSANGTATYQWKRNGVVLSGATGASYVIGAAGAGDNGHYQVLVTNSIGTTASQPIFVRVAPASTQVVGWGLATAGQISTPAGLTDAIAVSAGYYHSVALKRDGTLVAWGDDNSDQAAVPTERTFVAIAAGYYHTLAIVADATVTAWGSNPGGAATVPAGLTDVIAVAAGADHSLALKSNGTVVAWGTNTNGQANVPAGLVSVAAIAAGNSFSLALKTDGTVVAWGANGAGQTTVPAGLTGVIAIAAGNDFAAALKSDGTVVVWGDNTFGQRNVPAGLTGVTAISSGRYHTLALKANGTVSAFGNNGSGQLDAPADINGVFQLDAGGGHSLALRNATGDTAPLITAQPAATTAVEGLSATLSVSASGGTSILSYQWRKGGSPIGGATSASLTFNGVATTDSGSYDVVIANQLGSVISATAQLTVNPVPVITSLSTARQNFAAGQALTLSVTATGTGTLSYQWFRNGRALSGATSSTYSRPAATAADAGFYWVTVTDSVGPRRSAPIFLLYAPAVTDVVAWGDNTSGQISIPAGLSSAIAVGAGQRHSVALKSDGTVAAWGNNSNNQLNVPAGLASIVAVSAGDQHTLALKSDGTVAAWGYNASGQATVPAGLTGVVSVVAGANHSVALKTDGTVVAWGNNGSGQTTIPAGLSGVVGIGASANASFALKSDGTVVAWGYNGNGETNVPAGLNTAVALDAGNFHVLALKSDGTVAGWGFATFATPPAGLTGVTALSAGANHSLALKSDGTVAAWGSTGSGQVTVPQSLASVIAVSAGTSFSLALRTVANASTPVITSHPVSQTISQGGSVTFSVTATGTPPPTYQWRKGGIAIAGATSATLTLAAVPISAAGSYDVVVANAGGSVISNPATLTVTPAVAPAITTQPASQSVQIGQNVTFTVVATGTAPLSYQWFKNSVTIAGANTATLSLANVQTADAGVYSVAVSNAADSLTSSAAILTILPLPTITTQPANASVLSGATATFTVTASGNPTPTFQWQISTNGGASWSNLANGSGYSGVTTATLSIASVTASLSGNRYRALATNTGGTATSSGAILTVTSQAGVIAVAAGEYHSLLLKSDGALWAVGDNSGGQLGDGTTTNRLTPVQVTTNVVAIDAGAVHSVFVKADGTLWAMGGNSFGQLGDGTTTTRTTPVQIATNVAAVTAGNLETAFIKTDGTLWAMGRNLDGQLGDGTMLQRNSPVPVGSSVAAASLGYFHMLTVSTTGELRGVGGNVGGQLGDGTTVRRLDAVTVATGVTRIATGYTYSAFVKSDGTLWVMGTNGAGQLGDGTTTSRLTPVQVASGRSELKAAFLHMFSLNPAGALFGSGDNRNGQLGDGTTTTRATPVTSATNVAAVSARNFQSLWCKNDGSLWAAGLNSSSQLGDGTTTNRSTPVQVVTGALTAPATPVSVFATDGSSSDMVRVVWAHAIGATRYELWRNTQDASGTAVKLAGDLSVNFHEDRTAVAGPVYFYFVKAQNPAGVSAFSASDGGFRSAPVGAPAITTHPQSQTVAAGSSVTFTVVATGGAPLAYQWRRNNTALANATTASVTINAVSASDTGDYDVVVSNSGGTITSSVAKLTVSKLSQSVNFTAPANTTYSATPVALTASATSGLPVTFAVVSGPATVDGGNASLNGAGTVTIRASQAGDAIYEAAAAVDRTFTVAKATLLVRADDQNRPYGAGNPALTISYSGFVRADTTASLTTVPEASTSASGFSAVGTYVISLSSGTAANYTLVFTNGTLTVTKAPQVIEFTAPSGLRYGSAPFVASAGATSGTTVGISVVSGPATVANGIVTLTAPGTVTLRAMNPGNANYEAAEPVERTFTVGKAILTVRALDQSRLYGASNPALLVSYSGFVNGDSLPALTTAPQPATTATLTSSAGTYPITLTGGSAANYEFNLVNGTLTVGKAPLAVTAANLSRTYGAANPTFTFTYSGFLNNDTAAAITVPTASTTATTASAAGTYPITVSGGSATNYALTLAAGTLTVTKAPLTVTAANASRTVGAANPALTINYTGFANNDTAAALTAAPTVSTTATTASLPGVYPITLTGGSAANYTLTLVNGTLTVTPRDYRGTYFGTFASGGHWALSVNANATATYIAYLPARHSAIVVSLTVNPDGTFTVTGTEIKPLATAVSGSALASPEAPALRSAAATGDFTLSGQIAADGAVSGALTGLGETLTGAADTGPAQTTAGLYTATALNTASGATYTIVGASGQAVVVTTTPTAVDGAAGTVNSSGQLTATTSNNAALSLTINTAAQTVSASLTPSGSTTPITYAGLSATVTPIARVVNLSVRTTAGTGDQTLIVGLVIIGSGNKTLLLRGIGPALLAQGVTNALADPTMRLLNGSGAEVSANNDWGGSAQMSQNFSSVGAFALPASSKDAALFSTLATGLYSFHIFPNGAGTGIALAEVYDADDDTSAASVFNISARTQVGTGENILIAGFVITGNSPKTLLIRGLGPTLAAQGVTGALINPQLYLFGSAGLVGSNDDWGGTTALKNAFAVTGAGSLASDTSKDAALLVTLQPGVYSAQVSGVGGTTGVGLVEIFLMP
jgi:alpha-tubulin suppressor-like RCC1 family protein